MIRFAKWVPVINFIFLAIVFNGGLLIFGAPHPEYKYGDDMGMYIAVIFSLVFILLLANLVFAAACSDLYENANAITNIRAVARSNRKMVM